MRLTIQWGRQICPQTVMTYSGQGWEEGTQELEEPRGDIGPRLGGFREDFLEEGTLELRPGE